ncbi:hypothetical protein SAMN04489812_0056 [Microlunatus soli]|uniref:LicD family protein n=2 Tax=Microlunatus soli TaxID=630515 RepID=A0A1H1M9A2_9ACTN|nr:hypothetical protein SAMN04489812_0056 [Microlunatus soli]
MTYALEELVDTVDEIAETSFPDLEFLDPSGVLEVNARVSSVSTVRIELPSNEYFHLSSVQIDAEGVDDLVTATERVASSNWKGYGQLLAQGTLFDPDHRGTGFHTKKEQFPWVEFRFDRPVELRRLRFRNRGNATALRARGLRVRVRTAGGRWTTIYDGAERAQAFVRATEGIFGGVHDVEAAEGGGVVPAAADLVQLLTQVHLREYGPALVRDLAQIPISPAARAQFRDLVSQKVLGRRELEWTSHGVRRSFRFWKPAEKERYVAYSMELVADLRELTPHVCLGFGSVLAVVRDKDLIPHDDDLDIIVGFEPHEAAKIGDALRLIEKHLGARGYTVAGKNTAHRLVSRRPDKKVDVFVGIFEGDEIAWYPGRRGDLSRQIVFPAQEVEFLGTKCAIPARAETYLERIYGPGWKVPDRHFKHTWDRRGYADLIR